MRYVLAALSVASLAASGFVALMGYVVGGLRCLDACSSLSGWPGDPDTWQWTAIQLLSAGVGSVALVFVGALVARSPRLAFGLILLQGLLTVALAAFLEAGHAAGPKGAALAFLPLLPGVATLVVLRVDIRRSPACSHFSTS